MIELESLRLVAAGVERRPDRAGARVDLRLAEVERVRALDVARGDVVADRVRRGSGRARRATRPISGSGTFHVESPRIPIGSPGPTVRRHAGVLEEELGPVARRRRGRRRPDRALLHARVTAPLVRDAGAPDLGRIERRAAASARRASSRLYGRSRRHRVCPRARTTRPAGTASGRRCRRACGSGPRRPARRRRETRRRGRPIGTTRRISTTARPPEMSYVAPVENEHSSLASQQTSAATSSAAPMRPIGIRSTMYSTCSSASAVEHGRLDHGGGDAVDEHAGARDVLADRLRHARSPPPSPPSRRPPSGCPPCRRSRPR